MSNSVVGFKCTGEAVENFQYRFPEKDIQYSFTIKGSIAYHHLSLTYNKSRQVENIKFIFRLTEDTCFDHLSIKIGEEVLNCELKEKEEAKKDYQKALEEGKQAALGSIEEGRGSFSVNIGNVELNDDFQIIFKYIEQLSLKEQLFVMTLPFESNSNEIQFNNLTLIGDVFTQTEDDEIVSTQFINCDQNQSIKQTIITKTHTQITGSFQNNFVVQNDQQGIGQLYIRYDKPHMTLLSSFQNDSEISPYCALVNFVPHVISVKNSLKTINSSNKDLKESNLIKSEFIILIDRSGSMSGERIETAKQSLIFFLKSLPIGSIYNIVSFGSTYKMMYHYSVQLNDANLEESINQIQRFAADLGGTDIADPLQDIFKNLQDQYGLRKKIYILTDGEFSDGSKAQEVVKQNMKRCDVNVLTIGKDCSFQKAEEMAKVTGGYTQTVVSSSDIVPKVIQLLSDSFQNFDSISMNLTSDHDECINYIVPNPQSINYIDTTKTLRFYIFFNRKFEEANKIKFKLTTTYKGNQDIQDNFIVDQKSQIPNEQAHIHKMGLYQLIQQLTVNRQRKSESIEDDIQSAINLEQEEMKKLFTNEAIRYQILCEYTSFIGISQNRVKNNNSTGEDQSNTNFDHEFQQIQRMFSELGKLVQDQSMMLDTIECNVSGANQTVLMSKKQLNSAKRSSRSSCCGGGEGNYRSTNKKASFDLSNKQFNNNQQSHTSTVNDQLQINNNVNNQINTANLQKVKYSSSQESAYNQVILKQTAKGIWLYSEDLISILNLNAEEVKKINPIEKDVPNYEDIWVTLIVVYWLRQFYQDRVNQHQYVLLKAHSVTDRLLKQYSIIDPQKELKQLFQGYDLSQLK